MSSNVGAVESWHNFLTQCQQAIERFRERWGQTAIPFFRGQRDARWSVTPGAFRGPFNAYAEQAIYYEFKSGASMLLGSTLGPWDVLFTMQHHGLPTRLLDWTEVFSVALYFAVQEQADSAAVWMLDPYALNKITMNEDEILDVESDFDHDYFEYFIRDQGRTPFPADVVAIYPRRANVRIAGQRGLFTLHGSELRIEAKFSECIHKFEIPFECRDSARNFLALAGVNEYSIFPDLDGLCRFLKGRFEYLAASASTG